MFRRRYHKIKLKYRLLIAFCSVVFIIALAYLYSNIINYKVFNGKETDKYALGEIIEKQALMDEEINRYIGNKKITFDNPKVIVNPYEISPLSALIIFYTEESTGVRVFVNNNEVTKVEKTNSHSIPVYGLLSGQTNKIKLVLDNNKTKELTIKTDKYNGNLMKVDKTSDKLDDSLYFLSLNFEENTIYDKNGNLLWYVKGDYAGDIKYLDNGHFYISDPYQGTNGVKINYSSILEMDYLGKIYKQYITDYGYHHEIIELGDDKILTLGAKDKSKFFEGVLYIFDKNTGKVLDYIDMYEYLYKIAPKWIDSLGNNFDFVLNSASYDKKTNDVLLSCRGIGVILRLNLNTKEIKWMFGDPNNLPSEFDKYLLKVTDNTKYPYGEHSAFFTKDGNIAFHNNDADQLNMKSDKLVDYLDKYTTNVVVKVDENNKTLHTIWEYDASKKEFSKVAGYLEFLSNGNTLINYGWSIKEEAYQNPKNITINDTNYLNGVILELDNNKNVLFRGTTNGILYRVYKIKFYDNVTKNYKPSKYTKIDGTKTNGEEIDTKSVRFKLGTSKKYDGEFDVLINRIVLNTKNEIDINDEIKVLLVGEYDKSYGFVYKQKGKELRKFNTDYSGLFISVPEGNYKPYIIYNDKYYDTNIKMIFK